VDLASLLQALDRRDELARLARRLELRPASAAVDDALLIAYQGLGRPDDAVGRARARYEQLGTTASRLRLAGASEGVGRYADAEPLKRLAVGDHPERQHERFGLAANLAGQGRLIAGLREIDGAEYQTRTLGAGSADYLRAVVLTMRKSDDALWNVVSKAFAADPPIFACLAIPLALRGDLAHAERLATELPAGATRTQYEALRAWRAGDSAEALGALKRQLETGIEPPGGYHPAYLLAEVSVASDDPAGALSAIDRYRRSRVQGYWGLVATPRCGLLAARAHIALGHPDEARRELDRLLAELKRADPDLPLLREARALQASLANR
jgi:hypothetical protein